MGFLKYTPKVAFFIWNGCDRVLREGEDKDYLKKEQVILYSSNRLQLIKTKEIKYQHVQYDIYCISSLSTTQGYLD